MTLTEKNFVKDIIKEVIAEEFRIPAPVFIGDRKLSAIIDDIKADKIDEEELGSIIANWMGDSLRSGYRSGYMDAKKNKEPLYDRERIEKELPDYI